MGSSKLFRTATIIGLLLAACFVLASCGDKTVDEAENAEMIPVITYHKIKAYDPDDEATTLEMYDKTFKKQMDWLKKHGYKTLTMDEFYQWYKGEIEVPKKSVLVTFDDGFYGVYHFAYPVIKENGQAATAFLIGHRIGDTTPEWDGEDTSWRIGLDAIEEARSEYPDFSYESHSYNMHKKIKFRHPVNVFTREEMTEDCKSNERFGFTYLAYPWGDYNEEFQDVLKENGYKMAFGYDEDNFRYATRDDDQYAISRIRVDGDCSMREFKRIVKGKAKEYMPDREKSD